MLIPSNSRLMLTSRLQVLFEDIRSFERDQTED
jgi:hypothetical protein